MRPPRISPLSPTPPLFLSFAGGGARRGSARPPCPTGCADYASDASKATYVHDYAAAEPAAYVPYDEMALMGLPLTSEWDQ